MQDISFSINKNIALVNAEELLEIIKTVNITYNAIPDFEILFYAKDSTESYKVYKILDNSETDKYDYNIYGYNGIITNINSNSIVFEDKSRNKKYPIDVNSSLNF